MSRLFEDSGDSLQTVGDGLTGQPLAARMRPATADQLIGQRHLIKPGSALFEALHGRALHSMVLYGPPGSGKTTIARLIAIASDAAFEEESAVAAGRAEVRAAIDRARERRVASGRRTIFFLDEIHRFNKAQQDALLPAVEDGTLILIGATTENPYFEVNSALLSRCRLYTLTTLDQADLLALLRRALVDEHGLGSSIVADDDALEFIAHRSDGDARTALAALEIAAATAQVAPDGRIDLAHAEDALQRRAVLYDKQGDRHYDYSSALIKSMRGSDPDAAVYYLAAMLAGGEDPRFIARRIVILASEDIGNADPRALQVAIAAAHAVDYVGLPEARINLSQAVIYMAMAPKSNASYSAIKLASAEIAENGAKPPPAYLRDASYPGARELGHGVGYVYPHDHPAESLMQALMPEGLEQLSFYKPGLNGEETVTEQRLAELKATRKPREK